jgi:phosphohistidine phosphatase SixA
MDLYIIRHAWAGHHGDPQWPNDSLRPLTPEGKKRFATVVEKLVKRGFAPELLATSPMARCRQTADLVAAGLAQGAEVVELDELLPGSDLGALVNWTAQQAEAHRQVAWVGHAPDVGWLTAALIGQPDAWIRFAKGAVAAVRFAEVPMAGEGELRWMVTAKMLGC